MNILKLYSDYSVPYVNESPGWINTSCPFCQDAGNHLGFNIQSKYFNCWKCGSHKPVDTIMRLTGLDRNTVYKLLKSLRTPLKEKIGAEVRVKQKTLKLPSATDFTLGISAYHYLYRRRGFDPDEIKEKWDIWDTGPISFLEGIDYKHRLFIPIYHEGKMVSFQTRDITGKAKLKYLACPKEYEIIHHKHLLYGLDKAKERNYCIVVEGVFDVWRLGPPAVATFGIQYTEQQIELLCQNFDRVIILFDPEKQAQKQAQKLQAELEIRGVRSTRLDLINGDPAEKSKSDIKELKRYINRIVKGG